MAERMSDAAVQAKTGHTWPEWFDLLDSHGAQSMTHQEIVALVRDRYGVGPWWQQMVTVGYEQARGGRQKHERPGGYQISMSRTLGVPVAAAYDAFAEEQRRGAWLSDGSLTVTRATPGKGLRGAWAGGTRLDVRFYPKGEARAQVTVQHDKLPDADEAARMKTYWSAALDRLTTYLQP